MSDLATVVVAKDIAHRNRVAACLSANHEGKSFVVRVFRQGMQIDTDVIEILTKEHKHVREMLSKLQDAKGAEASKLLRKARTELEIHTQLEEEIVYPAYKKWLKSEDAKVLVHESLEEHSLVDRVLSDLDGLRPASASYRGKAVVLKELVDHHAEDEEEEMFPKFRRACPLKERRMIGARVARLRNELEADGSRQSKADLYDKAKKAGIPGRSKMDRQELEKALQG